MSVAVGRSSRTPFKHWILQNELGRLCGIFCNPKANLKVHAIACPFHVIDLCAGDGKHKDKNETSSPQIIRSLLLPCLPAAVDVKATFIERNPQTFAKLTQDVKPAKWIEFSQMDASRYRVPVIDKHQQIFVHADPNTISDWPINAGLLDSFSETTSMLCTLGCNVNGLKMLDRENREGWFDHISGVVSVLPRYHDVILVSLFNDAARWAYLVRLPTVWSEDTVRRILSAGQKFSDHQLNVATFRDSHSKFEAIQNYLFRTKKENGDDYLGNKGHKFNPTTTRIKTGHSRPHQKTLPGI